MPLSVSISRQAYAVVYAPTFHQTAATPKRAMPGAQLSVSMRTRPNSSARFARRSRPSWPRSNAPTASISTTERSNCWSSSTRIGPGARSRSPTAAPPLTSPPACANSPTFTFLTPSASESCSTICRRTRPATLYWAFPAVEARRVLRQLEFHYVPTTPGSTWLRSRSECCAANTSNGASPPSSSLSLRSPPGTPAQCLRRSHQMDVHNRESPRQNRPRLPSGQFEPLAPTFADLFKLQVCADPIFSSARIAAVAVER